MPGIDGFEVAKRIREFSSTYIVMLTARDEEFDLLQGLDSGADDYVTKPFRPRELRARIEAMLRRPRVQANSAPAAAAVAMAQSASAVAVVGSAQMAESSPIALMPVTDVDEETVLRHNNVCLNTDTRVVTLDGSEIDLTRSEFVLLAGLLESGRRVRSKHDLALLLRGDPYVTSSFVSETDKRAVEVHHDRGFRHRVPRDCGGQAGGQEDNDHSRVEERVADDAGINGGCDYHQEDRGCEQQQLGEEHRP
jgi:two-component system OmpR family response regulator